METTTRRALKDMTGAVTDDLLAPPAVRSDVVARARLLLETDGWCHAREVADELVHCLVDHKIP